MASYLRWSCKVKLRDSVLAKTLCHEYFGEYGFKVIKDTSDHLVYKRGSILTNFFTFNPLRWKTQVNIAITDNFLNCDFLISTIGQVPTNSEERAWEIFIDNFRRFIIDPGFNFRVENQFQLREAKKGNWTYLKEALLVGVLVAIPMAIIGNILGVDDLAPVGAAIGAGAAIMRRIHKERISK